MESRFLQYKGCKLHYRVSGKGKPLMLLHGFGEYGSVWRKQIEGLKDYRLIVPDLPGCGKSAFIDDPSMENLAEIIWFMWKEESKKEDDLGKFVLIGHSMGGYITLAFAEKYPDALAGFGLFHSTAFADDAEKKDMRRKGIDFIRQHGAEAFLKPATLNLFSSYTKEFKPEIIEEQLAGINNFSGNTLVSYYNAMINRPDRTAVLQKARVPVLFILGRADKAVPLFDGLKLCFMPEIAYIHILDNSAHMGMQEAIVESNQILLNYLLYTFKTS